MSSDKPNILFIQVDQLTASRLACYGNSVSIAPTISQIAETGVVFDRAYSNFPLCAPSRFSMLSGRLASDIEAYDNGSEFMSSIPTMAHFLRAAGYQTCLVGKMHFVGADQLHGYESRLTTDIYPADFGWTGDWTEVTQKHSNDLRSFSKAGICIRNPQMEYDEEISHRAQRKLYDIVRNRETDNRPFFLTLSYTHPHDPYQCRQEHWDLYQHENIDMPLVERPVDGEDPYSQRLRLQYGLNRADKGANEVTNEMIRIARHAYYGSISYVDQEIKKVLDTLKETGLDENTVIVFTSDHGDMLGERGLWYKKSFFEDSVRVPLLISGPTIKAQRCSLPVSLVDLAPTLVNIADYDGALRERPRSQKLIDQFEGCDLLGLIEGGSEDRPDDRVIYAENLAEGAMAPIVMVCSKRYKYIQSGCDPEQLFDLVADPLELTNQAETSNYQDVVVKMRSLTAKRWDLDELHKRVEQSQNKRLFVRSVLGPKASFDWDFAAEDQASDQCLRADRTYNEWAYDDVIGLRKPV